MKSYREFYISGRWVAAAGTAMLPVVDPATDAPFAEIALAGATDVDAAVAAARRAFDGYPRTSRQERIELLEALIEEYRKRHDEMAEAISQEMGAPIELARRPQAAAGLDHLQQSPAVLRDYRFDSLLNNALVTREPSEIAPISAPLFTEMVHAAGIPAGVYNMINCDGPVAGEALARHPDIDMVSSTDSARAGALVAKAAADIIKRVHQELGGKSPNILLDDADFDSAVSRSVRSCFCNSGRSCNAPTRLLVPRARRDEVVTLARKAAEAVYVSPPRAGTIMGPVVSEVQFERIQRLINIAIAEGATLVTGAPGRPEGLERGCYVCPTIFAGGNNNMAIAREEVFGSVLAIIPYDTEEEEAIAISNDTPYGLSSYITSADRDRARRVARRIRAGMVHLNGAPLDSAVPFGDYKPSGNGREGGVFGFEDFLEVKAVFGHGREDVAA